MMKTVVFLGVILLQKGIFAVLVLNGPPHDIVVPVGGTVTIPCEVREEHASLTTSSSESNKVKHHAQPVIEHLPATDYSVLWVFISLTSENKNVLTTSVDENGTVIPVSMDSEKYESRNSTSLTLLNVSFSDAGVYRCQDAKSDVAIHVSLFVVGSPECSNKRPIVGPREYTLFECAIQYAGSSPPNLTWHQDNDRLMDMHENVKDGYVSTRLSFPAMPEDKGQLYTCLISYDQAKWHHLCHANPPLDVLIPVHVPTVIVNPYSKSHQYHRGDNITLYCSTFGNPAPHYLWQFQALNGEKTVNLSNLHFYHIERVNERDMGSYVCFVSNHIHGEVYLDNQSVKIVLDDEDTSAPYVNVNSKPDKAAVKGKPDNVSPYAIGAVISAVVAILLIVIFVGLVLRIKRRDKHARERLARTHDETLDDQEAELLDENIQPRTDELPVEYSNLRQNWEIGRKNIRLMDLIGYGAYTEVWKARVKRYSHRDEVVRAVVRKCKNDAVDKEKRFFSAELEVMKMLQSHPNVIQLIGCYTASEPHLMITEYAGDGNLQDYLQLRRPGNKDVTIEISNGGTQAVRLNTQSMTSRRLLEIIAQVIMGLDHLARFRLICYRLQSRNILVDKRGLCKLSGFGFPQDIAEKNHHISSAVPVRWLAPECTDLHRFDGKTDVWALGIVMWEVLHFGVTPYFEISDQSVLEQVKAGYRLTQPAHISYSLYHLMARCWEEEAEQRPLYAEMHGLLMQLLTSPDEHICIDKLPAWVTSTEADADKSHDVAIL